MTAPDTPPQPTEDRAFAWLLVAVSLAFAAVLWPFSSAVLWALVFAALFTRLNRRIGRRLGARPNLSALATLTLVMLLVILPLIGVGAMLAEQASGLYERMKSGDIDYGAYLAQVLEALPAWMTGLLERFGLADVASLQQRFRETFLQGGKFFAGQALSVGQNTLQFVVSLFVMLYLLFFLLRDGDKLMRIVGRAVPLRNDHKRALRKKLGVVVRATMKGNVVVAILQGGLGGLIFWVLGIHAALLWGVVMAIFSLLPAVGTALVWGPAAIYFLATGSPVKGIVLLAFGTLVIGLVDNVVRPMLVGKDTRMPDWLVLLTTLGGIALFGVNGFLLGPLIAALFVAAWDLFAESRAEEA